MYPSKSPSKQIPPKSALGNLLLSEKGLKPSSRSTLVSPVLQQVGKLAAGVANVATEFSVSGSATGRQLFVFVYKRCKYNFSKFFCWLWGNVMQIVMQR